MKVEIIAYYTDGSSKVVRFEKPSGAHPDSIMSFRVALEAAEYTGLTVDRLDSGVVVKKRSEIVQ